MSDSVSDSIREVKADLRNLLYGAIGACVALLSVILGSHVILSSQTRALAEQVWNFEKNQAVTNGKIDTLDAKMSAKMDSMLERLNDKYSNGSVKK